MYNVAEKHQAVLTNLKYGVIILLQFHRMVILLTKIRGEIMYCSNCGAENSKKICVNCGVKQGKTHKYCKWCGAELTENASVCVQCNKKVKENGFVKFLITAAEIIVSLIFTVVFIASFNYFSKGVILGGILLLIFGLLGLVAAFPLIRKIYKKKIKIIDKFPVRIGIIAVLLVIIYGFVYPYANNQVAVNEKQTAYDEAVAVMETDPLTAKAKFVELADFKDSAEKAQEVNEYIYKKLGENINVDFSTEEEISDVEKYVDNLPDDFDDSLGYIKEFKYKKGNWMLDNHFYAMAKRTFADIADYKDVNELMQNPVYGLMGNRYTCSLSVGIGYESYIQTQLLRFNDSINSSFSAAYTLSNATLSGMLSGDFGSSYDPVTYLCYEENGKIYVGKHELTRIKTEDDKIVSFVYDGQLFEIAIIE